MTERIMWIKQITSGQSGCERMWDRDVNTFYVNYMTKTFGGLAQNRSFPGLAGNRCGRGMADAILEAAKRAGVADQAQAARVNGSGAEKSTVGPNTEAETQTGERTAADQAGGADAETPTGETNTVRQTGGMDTEALTGGNTAARQTGGTSTEALTDRTNAMRLAVDAMTPEEYKEYIRERIFALPMHVSHMQDAVTITISDEGLAAMKRDAEYEEWVLNDLRAGWAWENPWARYLGGAYSVIHYGATKEECHAEMWNAGFRHGDGKGLFESMSGNDEEDKKRKSEIIVRPDGSRYLVISEVIGGMKVTVLSIKLTKPEELMQKASDMENSAAVQALQKTGTMPV
ncbi:MAG: hypothetical protein NC254_01190 [bacterium]|nr:hypothetical protein [bacterium]